MRAIDWLKVASMTAAARNLRVSWDQINGNQERAGARGLARREAISPRRIGVDETSFQKRHGYVTIVTGLDDSRVLYVDDITRRLCFDRFHVAQLSSKAVDQVRRSETKRLSKEGDDRLKGSRYLLLMAPKLRRQLAFLLETASSVSGVWAIKDAASQLWKCKSRSWATKAWTTLCEAARKVEIPALDAVIDTVLRHLFGVVDAVIHRASNAASESVNSRVQALKRRANGYRRRDRFRAAIMFHLGALDLYPFRGTPLQIR